LTDAAPIWFVQPETWGEVRAAIGATAARFADACYFEPKPGRLQLLPGADGALAGVLFGETSSNDGDALATGKLATALPAGKYRFANAPRDAELAALGFLLGLYRFDNYKPDPAPRPELIEPEGVDWTKLQRVAAAIAFGRDLVNRPANDLTPAALEDEATQLALGFGASVETTRGDDLLARNLPLIHAVGAAAAESPRLVDFVWGRLEAPKVTLVGKGVVFDTGGLDIKPASGMELMKKDMGGAATALTLARLIMEAKLGVRLRVLVPTVENSISARAMRPGDILRSRKGLTVEIGNTDAEGRLILADALALAAEEAPELMIDFATLTGAARVALGPDLSPFYTDDDALASEIEKYAASAQDPVWRLPLWRPYESMLESRFADLNNSPGSPFAGSVTAALFLRRFAEGARGWAHFDVYAWNPKPRAYGPQGGEIQSARALFGLLCARFPA
jgi:leucyl aminopeptidase